jgi:hypothetical protein
MNKKVLDRLRKSFRQLEEREFLPKAPRRVVASSDPGLVITSFGKGSEQRRAKEPAVVEQRPRRKPER